MYGGRGRGRGGPGEGEGPMQPHRLRRVAGGPTVHRSTSDEWSAGERSHTAGGRANGNATANAQRALRSQNTVRKIINISH
jgi:hypothetical protein